MARSAIDWNDADAVRGMVLRRFERCQRFRTPYEKLWRVLWRHYRFYKEARDARDPRPNLVIPEAFSRIETVTPRVIGALFASRPWVAVAPREPGDVQNAPTVEMLLDYQLAERMDILPKMVDWVKNALIFGTAVGKTVWRLETQERVVGRKPVFPDGRDVRSRLMRAFRIPAGFEPDRREVIVYDDPEFDVVDPWHFWWDPRARDLREMRYCFHRSIRTRAELQELERQGIYGQVDDIPDGIEGGPTGSDVRRQEIGYPAAGEDEDGDEVEVLEYWQPDRIVALGNRQTVLRNSPNPFWHGQLPFVAIHDHPVPGEFWSIGEIEPLVDLAEELNTFRNQRLHRANILTGLPFIANKMLEVNPDDLVLKAHHIIWVGNVPEGMKLEDVLTTVRLPDVPPSSYSEEAVIKQDMDRTTGVYDPVRGALSDQGTTATEVVAVQDQANFRFRLKIQLMEFSGLRRLARQVVQLDQQFIDRARAVRITGQPPAFVDIPPEQIIGEFDFIPAGSSVEPIANKQVRQKQLVELYGLVQNDPRVNKPKLLRKIFEAHDIKDVDDLISEEAPAVPGAPASPAAAAMLGGTGTEGPAAPAPLTLVGGQAPRLP